MLRHLFFPFVHTVFLYVYTLCNWTERERDKLAVWRFYFKCSREHNVTALTWSCDRFEGGLREDRPPALASWALDFPTDVSRRAVSGTSVKESIPSCDFSMLDIITSPSRRKNKNSYHILQLLNLFVCWQGVSSILWKQGYYEVYILWIQALWSLETSLYNQSSFAPKSEICT